MTDHRNDYGFPYGDLIAAFTSSGGAGMVGLITYRNPITKLERAQAYAADVRARRGMVVRKGVYLDPIK